MVFTFHHKDTGQTWSVTFPINNNSMANGSDLVLPPEFLALLCIQCQPRLPQPLMSSSKPDTRFMSEVSPIDDRAWRRITRGQ